MSNGYVLPREEAAAAKYHSDRLRAAVEQRSKEKGISLAQALLEIGSQGKFSAENRARDTAIAKQRREADGCRGWARGKLARAVEDKKRELLGRDSGLSELAAFRKAIEIVLRNDPILLFDYRNDVLTINPRG
jgi:hypothetical protein